MQLLPEQELGSYRLISRIGAGGMGEVWRAEDLKLRRTVAVKILSPSVAVTAESQARLTREARTAAQLYHPNIATIHAIEQHGDIAFIVMEYVDGEPLTRRVEQGPMPESEVLSIARQIAEALAEAHSRGIVHRDIKPDNVVLSGGRLKVLDFGIAKQIGPVTASSDALSDYATAAGIVLGTVYYMSPEQALGQPLDARTDLFSLGVLMYQALAGALPFVGLTITDTMTRIIRDEAPPVRALNPTVSAAVEHIVERCMQKNRDYRYADARELIEAIDRVSASGPTVALAAGPAQTLPSRTVPISLENPFARPASAGRRWALVLGAAVILIAASLFFFMNDRELLPGSSPATIASVGVPLSPSDAVPIEVQSSPVIDDEPATAVSNETLKDDSPPAQQARPAQQSDVVAGTPEESSTEVAAPSGASAEELYRSGLRLFSSRPVAALTAFRAAIEKDPEFAPARMKAAQLLLRVQPEESANQFRRALESPGRLDERQVALASLGVAVAERDLQRGRALAKTFAARYPNDPDLRWFMKEADRIMNGGEGNRPLRPGSRRRSSG